MDFRDLAEMVDDTILDSPIGDSGIVFFPLPGVELAVRGVFAKSSSQLEMGEGVGVISDQGPPELRVVLKDFLPHEPVKNQYFTIKGQYYQIAEVHPDGLGAARIELRRANAPA